LVSRPFFSVLVTAYNRGDQIERCVSSCTAQTYTDFEIVVVDDGSQDDTLAVLQDIDEPRLRVVAHEQNRGIAPARATSVKQAQGEWLVFLDSDWELVPGSLARLRQAIETVPSGVRIIRSRLAWDDGGTSPSVIPDGVTDYRGRLDWLEAVASTDRSYDAGQCVHRAVFEAGNHFHDGRGIFETLWETNLAREESSLWLPDVLGLEHIDAANSTTREAGAALIPRMLAEARDVRWQVETMLSEHGDELALHAPHYRLELLERAALESFLAGDRLAGIRHTREGMRAGAGGVQPWATAVLGVLGPRALAYVKLAGRRLRSWRTQTS
jgi:hypothetical protein